MRRWLTVMVLTAILTTFIPVQPAQSSVGQQERLRQNGPAPIYLRGQTLYPWQEQPQLSPNLVQPSTDGEGLRLVQFSGPIQPQWLEALQSEGLKTVTYLPDYAYLVWGEHPLAQLERAAALLQGAITWVGDYHPSYRLAPELQDAATAAPSLDGSTGEMDVTVQFYNSGQLKNSLSKVTGLARQVLQAPVTINDLTNLRVRIASGDLSQIAALPDVITVEPFQAPELLDETQGQILTGSLSNVGGKLLPSGPGYLAWLDSKGFPKDTGAYPIVDVVDDGLDGGNADGVIHPDFYVSGDKTQPDRVMYAGNCTVDASGNSVGGHGNLNAGILAGYNNQSGFPYVDSSGYRYGLGISPFGPLASTKVFTASGYFDLSKCGDSMPQMVYQSYEEGARIGSNSWGAQVGGSYNVEAQTYDFLTRDASNANGNQEMLHIFAAGNAGNGPKTINSPASAKNVLTVGASENVRDHNINDGCYATEADSADDVAVFSSRGPTSDGRIKPDILAPGTHIQGPASQDSAYNAGGVCGASSSSGKSPYYPAGQTLYTWSSGTSHSTPAIAGMAQLLYSHYQRVLAPGKTPSPAMLKALILNTPRYLSGTGANDTLPSNAQGWGLADMGAAFDNTPRLLMDQTNLLRSSGESYHMVGQVQDPTKPFRVSLVWTDAPGSVSAGRVGVNDLDLEVVIGGQTYRGNVFSGAQSTQGGVADRLNNVESIFLPAGFQGFFQVRVIAYNLAGDGVPGNASALDQDFALVVYNGSEAQAPVFSLSEMKWTQVHGNNNGAIDPGETIELQIELQNQGATSSGTFSTTLRSSAPDVTILTPTIDFPDTVPDGTATGLQPFRIKVGYDPACDTQIPLALELNVPSFPDTLVLPSLSIGKKIERQYRSTAVPVDIPDMANNVPGEVQVPVNIQDTYLASDINVAVNITHGWVSDLNLALIPPWGTPIRLSTKNGGMGDNYENTIFDDHAEISIATGLPPFTGPHRPEDPLSVINGQKMDGRWVLNVQDINAGDVGRVLNFTLMATETRCSAYTSVVDLQVAQSSATQSASPGGSVLFTVLVTNTGAKTDTFTLSSNSEWEITMPQTVGPLAPGQSQPTEVQLKVPVGTPTQRNYQTILTAASKGTPGSRADILLFVYVGNRTLLPWVTIYP